MRHVYVAPVAVLIVLLTACGGRPDGRSGSSPDWDADAAAAAQPSVAVEALEVSFGSILAAVEAAGTVRGVSEATVVSEVEGLIERANFQLGQFLERGAILAGVDATVAALSLEEARLAAESARIERAAVERRFEAGSASQTELSRARSTANGAQARLEAAQEFFNDHTITAPISGFVAARPAAIARGNYLTRGATVARLVDLSRYQMEVAVGERELAFLEVGAPALVSIPACGSQPYPATVQSIAAGSDPVTGSFPVIVEWDEACASIRSGVSASVRIEPLGADPAVIIPGSAIQQADGQAYVYVAGSGSVARRAIRVGERLGDRVQVLSGLEAGEVIVTSALSALSDGAAVDATIVGRTGDVL